MKKCSIEAFRKCPEHEYCGWPAEFADGSECDKYNEQVGQSEISGLTINPGAGVWVVEEYEVSCYMFLAIVNEYVIATSYINDYETVEETMAYHAWETQENYDTHLCVFPSSNCFRTFEEAGAALEGLYGTHV